MYLEYFGFKKMPFENLCEREFFFESENHRSYTKIKFSPRFDSEIRYISLESTYSYPYPINSVINDLFLYLFDDQNNLIATTSVKISNQLGYHYACRMQNFYMLELDQPFVVEKGKNYIIKTSHSSFRFKEICLGHGFRLEGHMF